VNLSAENPDKGSAGKERRRELLTFFVLAFGIWPLVAVAVVGGFGFLVWMWQIIFGPPGPPPGLLH
jgi:nitrate reductase NapE